MAEHHHHEATCPVCSGTLTALTDDDLVVKFQLHAKQEHGKDLTKEQVRGMFKDKAK